MWQNITTTFEGAANASAKARLNSTANNQISNNGTLFNQTAANNTLKGIFGTDVNPEPFYLKILPRELLLLILISPLYYHWHLWLERFLPARPRVTSLMPAGGKSALGDWNTREEEIVQRWIAQGKVRRASLSWWNTFFKWIINLTVGTWWIETLRFLLTEMITGKSPITVLRMMFGMVSSDDLNGASIAANLYQRIPFRFFTSILSMRPWAALLAFIVVPAHQRMTFEAGAGLVWDLFFGVFVTVVISWIANAPFAQRAVARWMENMNNATATARHEL
jgi:hypothetical protein